MTHKSLLIALVAIFCVLVGGLIVYQSQRRPRSAEVVGNTAISPIGNSSNQPNDTPLPQITSNLSLQIDSIANGDIVTDALLVISGTTQPDAEVFINDKEVLADDNGRFSVSLTLDEGENSIFIVANTSEGDFAAEELVVIYDALEETP